MVIWNHGEFPPDKGEEFEEKGFDLEIIIEVKPILPKDVIPDDFCWDKFIPKDDYLQKELEREKQEKLEKMLPKKIP